MKQVYQTIEKVREKEFEKEQQLIPIPKFPSREAEFACYRDQKLSEVSTEDLVALWDQLGIYYNVRSSQIKEWHQRILQAKSGWKEMKNVYFFIHAKKLYIIKAAPLRKGGQGGFWKEYVTVNQPITKL